MDTLQLVGTEWITQEGGRATAHGERATGHDASARWLRELERAQWTLRGSRAALPVSAPSRIQSSQEAARLPGASRSSAAPERTAGPRPAAMQPPPDHAYSDSPAATADSVLRANDAPRGVNGAETRAPNAERRGCARAEARPAFQPPLPNPTAWRRVNVHAYRGEDAVDVWVRDASLDEREQERLAAELRAGLSRRGERLGTLVVNGQAVAPASSAASGDDGNDSAKAT
jgi:hypothetical protein